MENSVLPKLYTDLAAWWPVLSAPADYAEEAEFYRQQLQAAAEVPPRTMLELGCGGGNNASHLKAHFELTLTDLAPRMLEVSRVLNPECEHVAGDMRSIRLNREFDTVFVGDAICYMTTRDDLRAAIQTAFVHCRPGGAALFVPDHIKEAFRPATKYGGHDEEGRRLRYFEWTYDPDLEDDTYVAHFAYLLRDEAGHVEASYDRHSLGLFSREVWLELIGAAGFSVRCVPFDSTDDGPEAAWVFVAAKPSD